MIFKDYYKMLGLDTNKVETNFAEERRLKMQVK